MCAELGLCSKHAQTIGRLSFLRDFIRVVVVLWLEHFNVGNVLFLGSLRSNAIIEKLLPFVVLVSSLIPCSDVSMKSIANNAAAEQYKRSTNLLLPDSGTHGL